MLDDVEKDTVEMVPNYDERLMEPTVLPGGLATFTFRVRGPSVPGVYPLRLRPVDDD